MTTELAAQEPQGIMSAPASPAATPMSMLAAAVQSGMDASTIKDLMALQERWEANESRRAYNAAFSSFKSQAVKVIKNRTVDAGPLSGKKYAELFAVVNAITPALSANGLSASWKITKDEKDWIEVTCVLTHVLGHSESVSMGGPPDAGGAKSAIQARASTVSYLERYTLKAICGISEQGDDSDGGKVTETVSVEQAATIQALAEDVGVDVTAFFAYMAKACKARIASFDDIPASAYNDAVRAVERKRAKA